MGQVLQFNHIYMQIYSNLGPTIKMRIYSKGIKYKKGLKQNLSSQEILLLIKHNS